jgi:hypothetical protein
MNTDRPTIPCRCCNGSGREALPPEYADTIAMMRKFSHGATTADLLAMPIQAMETRTEPNALAMRLNRMERWGLVIRHGKRGKLIVWGLGAALMPKAKPCACCCHRPEWRHGGGGVWRLVHSSDACPNRVVVADVTPAKVARQWNTNSFRRIP